MGLSARQFEEVTGQTAKGRQLRGEKRGAIRIPFGRRSVVLTDSGLMTILIRELSFGGASLMASRAIPVGDELILCLPRSQGVDLQVKCTVLRCDRGLGDRVFLVGLKFKQALSAEGGDPTVADG
jgi:hypothetical protein